LREKAYSLKDYQIEYYALTQYKTFITMKEKEFFPSANSFSPVALALEIIL